MTVRTRYAPSPTGALHIGNVRSGLFAYLFARHNHGAFILRIDDTDPTRNLPGGEEALGTEEHAHARHHILDSARADCFVTTTIRNGMKVAMNTATHREST